MLKTSSAGVDASSAEMARKSGVSSTSHTSARCVAAEALTQQRSITNRSFGFPHTMP